VGFGEILYIVSPTQPTLPELQLSMRDILEMTIGD
jgi:hypothetical protein